MHPVPVMKDEDFMRRALELAALGKGSVSPNPMVGCVIVHEGKIIGEGWHKRFGEAHAEVNAAGSVVNRSLLRDSTVYVNLEPCAHFGKTPPCADMLIREKVKEVVIANTDSNPLVAGAGIRKLTGAGISVRKGICETEGRELNKRFFTFMEKRRPYIILKWAQTADGFMAREDHNSKWISNETSRQLVHKWRSEEDAVLVGTNTALYDDPKLTVRDWKGKNPVRIVIDRSLKLPAHLHLFDRASLTCCYNTIRDSQSNNLEFVKLGKDNFLFDLVQDLYKRKIQSLIVEGGKETLKGFIGAGLWDEALVFISKQTFGNGIQAPGLNREFLSETRIDTDTLRTYRNTILSVIDPGGVSLK